LSELDRSQVDIYVKQRNGRKCITTVQGLGNDKDELKSIAKDLRKKMSCSGSIGNDDGQLFLKFSGKDTDTIVDYLIKKLDYSKDNIVIHGI
tara:strand:- start:36 stop:311 length:276 start_codon:yes stop_codon:yes gene_type:complete